MAINKDYALLSKAVAAACVRNTSIEDIHVGKTPFSKKGDFSDVIVTDANGHQFSWNECSRISEEEMKVFMKDVVNKLYKYFENQFNEDYIRNTLEYHYKFAKHWDDPEE